MMANLAFIIDQEKCIGCHACTVACKEENQVPLGVNRTWVKYIEKGQFANARRFFSVLRCNHCEDAPCVEICPTEALFKRSNGIVDFDNSRCIGCKACMQACPYDALYIDPQTDTAAKCHFCAHRVEIGLQPACVTVCPERAIITGDMDDPESEVSRILGRKVTHVRKPEQATKPKLFYVGADEASLSPSLTTPSENNFCGERMEENAAPVGRSSKSAKTVYDVSHPRPWGWKVSLYLWTKSVASGAFLITSFQSILGQSPESPSLPVLSAGVSLFFLAVTGVLLVADLKHPERFYYILIRPQWRSWLALGAYIITIYGLLLTLWLFASLFACPVAQALAWPGVVFAVLASIYTGFLFGQAEGRDLWQSPVYPPALLAQAVIAGAGVLVFLAIASGEADLTPLRWTLGAGLAFHSLLLVLGEISVRHGTNETREAARILTRGSLSRTFWVGTILLGTLFPMVLLVLFDGALFVGTASILGLAGLLIFDEVWVKAGQAVPLS